MSKIKLIVLLLFAGTSVQLMASKIVTTISGKITNPTSDSVFLYDKNDALVKGVKLGKKNTFKIEVEIEEGYYDLSDGNEQTKLFLSPGFNINISLNTKEFDESINYTGKGAAENNYLAQSYLLDERLDKLKSYSYYAKLNETAFLSLSDSVLQLELALLNQYKNEQLLSFYETEKMKLEYTYYLKLYNYRSMHSMITSTPNFKTSDQFPNPFKNIVLDKAEWVKYYEYTNVVESYLEHLASIDIEQKVDSDYYLSFFKHLENQIKLPELREKFAYSFGKYRLNYVVQLDEVYAKIKTNLRSEEKIQEVEKVYLKMKALKSKTLLPKFQFKDINNRQVNLEDFKGKFVYIDVWATWCGPCVYEIPHLKKLQDTLEGKNIVLISICKSDYEQNWRSFVAKKDLKGVQLFAEESQTQFFDDFIVSGIPRFILLDKEGKIIEYDAKRPSDPKLLEQLLKLLN